MDLIDDVVEINREALSMTRVHRSARLQPVPALAHSVEQIPHVIAPVGHAAFDRWLHLNDPCLSMRWSRPVSLSAGSKAASTMFAKLFFDRLVESVPSLFPKCFQALIDRVGRRPTPVEISKARDDALAQRGA
jgi:hypothetical protein